MGYYVGVREMRERKMPRSRPSTQQATAQAQEILDRRFKPGSGARLVAEALLAGGPQNRHELHLRFGVPQPTVNRVVDMLTEEGCHFHRSMDGRQSVFTLTSIGTPPHPAPYPALKATAQMVGANMVDSSYVLDFVIGKFRYRGTLKHLLKGDLPIGQSGTVVATEAETETTCSTVLEFRGNRRLTLVGVKAVTV